MALVVFGALATMVVLRTRFADRPPANVRPVAFEVRLAEITPASGLTEATLSAAPAQTVYLHPDPLLTNADLESAAAVDLDGQTGIEFSTTAVGGARLRQATAANIGKHLAILIDGEVRIAPRITVAIGGKGVITGDFSPVDAERIAAGMMQH